jgi:RsiW-degrading membrane proteinase PrsW (M82 family)
MGFATVENIKYVLEYAQVGRGVEVGIQRMFLSVPAHATFGVIMGYFVGKAKFDQKNSLKLMLIGIGGAILFHGTYDFFLFLDSYSYVGQQTASGLLVGGAIISFIVAITLSRKLFRRQRLLSEQTFKNKHAPPRV